MNKRQRKKEEKKLFKGSSRTPRFYPYYVIASCCGSLIARYAVYTPLAYVSIRLWRTEKHLEFRMVEGEKVPPCPACGGKGRAVLARDYKEHIKLSREYRLAAAVSKK